MSLIRAEGLDVVVEATGSPAAAVRHCVESLRRGPHVVMVTVEADVVAGPALARRARAQGVVYSLGYGDPPALVCELVDWARVCGFEVICAGKGTRSLPHYHFVTPDEVWDHYGLPPELVQRGDLNARMFTSFLDGTKSAVEMAAVANATGLVPQREGLRFPPCGARPPASPSSGWRWRSGTCGRGRPWTARGCTVYGRLLPSQQADGQEALPVGLAHGVPVRKPVHAGQVVRLHDVELDVSQELVQL